MFEDVTAETNEYAFGLPMELRQPFSLVLQSEHWNILVSKAFGGEYIVRLDQVISRGPVHFESKTCYILRTEDKGIALRLSHFLSDVLSDQSPHNNWEKEIPNAIRWIARWNGVVTHGIFSRLEL